MIQSHVQSSGHCKQVNVMTLNLQDGQMRFQATDLHYLVAVQG